MIVVVEQDTKLLCVGNFFARYVVPMDIYSNGATESSQVPPTGKPLMVSTLEQTVNKLGFTPVVNVSLYFARKHSLLIDSEAQVNLISKEAISTNIPINHNNKVLILDCQELTLG